MKVVHTFASQQVIWKERIYAQMLSALYAKKHYGNIHLYTTEKEAEQINKIGIPYDSINTSLLNDIDCTTYSLPKLYTFTDINEPFLHIDIDSVFYYKFDFSIFKSPFVFSHPDMKHFTGMEGTLGEHITMLLNNKDSNVSNGDFYWINYTYLKLYQTLLDQQPEDVKNNFEFDHIPNMSIVMVNDPATFKLAAQDCIDHYFMNKELVDGREMGPHYVEQLMMHLNLLKHSPDYRKYVKKDDTLVFNDAPLFISFQTQQTSKLNIAGTKFPFTFRTNSRCSHCGESKFEEYTINSIEDIKRFLGFKFRGYTHFSFMQWYQLWQVVIINEIVEEFGSEYVLSCNNYFKENPMVDKPLYSESELLYERFSGKRIFTGGSII